MPKMKKKTKTKNGNTVVQELKSTQFFADFEKWKDDHDEGISFLLQHGIQSSKTAKRKVTMETIEGASRGHRDHLPKLMEVMDYDEFIGAKEIEYIKKYIKFIEAAKGTTADPAKVSWHDKIYNKDGKVVGKRKVWGHYATKNFVENSKGDHTEVPESYYTYNANELAQNPPHKAVYSEKSPRGLLPILKDALKELDDADLKFEITRVSNPKELYNLSEVRQFLESQLTTSFVKEGKINARAIATNLAAKKFGVSGEAEEAIVRRLSGFSEDEVTGDVEEFTVKVSPTVVERAYLASKKKKVGGFYLHGKVLDKRPRKGGEPVAKSWLDILKRKSSGIHMAHWLQILVQYDLPLAIAQQLKDYADTSSINKKRELSRKLSWLDQHNQGAKIGEISKEIEELVRRYDASKSYRGVAPLERKDYTTLTQSQIDQISRYAMHLIEQA
jgi:hypothetical protein